MTYINIIVFLYAFCIFQWVDDVFAMNLESISGGYPARLNQFSYQVAIVVTQNQSKSVSLVCSGGFVAKHLILSAAQCFVNNNGDLKAYQYSIITDTVNWRIINGIEVLIDLIYLPGGGNYYLNNIALAKLHGDFRIAKNPGLITLDIPYSSESIFGKVGIVAGYGFAVPLILYKSGYFRDLLEDINDYLQYARVLITRKSLCVPGNKSIDKKKQFCGLMFTEIPGQSWGICEKDIGSPLVLKKKIVGVAGTNHESCNDTLHGVAYTKVSAYASFIHSIIDGKPLPGTLIHRNREHVFHLVSPAA